MSGLIWDILLILGITLVAGLFVADEIALVSLRESQIRTLAERGSRGRRLAKLVEDPNRFLAAVQVGVTVLGFLSAALGAERLGVYLQPVLVRWGISEGFANVLALLLVTLGVAYVSLVLGELTPKRIGIQHAEGISLAVAPLVDGIAKFLRPVIWLLSKSTNVVVRLFGGDPNAGRGEISGDELRGLVASNESLSGDERQLIGEVLDAGHRPIREIMLPRPDVAFLDANLTISKAVKVAKDSPHSRYPVVRRSQDDVVGFVHIRDLLLPANPDDRSVTVGDLVREVARLPGSKKVLAAMSEMRRSGHHLAIVVDEYGGTDGIVTLEDLIEEIIGDIRDEYDLEEAPAATFGVGEFEVDARVNLDEFEDITGVELEEGPYETAAGYVLARLGRLPIPGDEVQVDASDFDVLLNVAEIDGRRISKLHVIRTAKNRDEHEVNEGKANS